MKIKTTTNLRDLKINDIVSYDDMNFIVIDLDTTMLHKHFYAKLLRYNIISQTKMIVRLYQHQITKPLKVIR